MTINCKGCGSLVFTQSEIDPETTLNGHRIVMNMAAMVLCNDCADRRTEESLRRAGIDTPKAAWLKLCPEEFRRTEPHRLPKPDRLERVMAWKFGPKGMLLTGPTGRGKSRCAWKLCQREHFAGRSVAVIDCLFALNYAKRMNVSSAKAMAWIEEKLSAKILLLDDVFKVRLDNSGAESALFAIINARTEERRPMIITTQDNGETLTERMSADRGAAMVRRMRESCEVVSFN